MRALQEGPLLAPHDSADSASDIIVPPNPEWGFPYFLDKEGPYSMFCVTNTTLKMDRQFGLSIRDIGNISDDADYELRKALLFTPMSFETTKTAEFFVKLAKQFNFFHAIPDREVSSSGLVTAHDLDEAIKEGYVARTHFPQWDITVAHLTPKFGSHTLPPSRRDL